MKKYFVTGEDGHLEEKDRPETFNELWWLCYDLKASNLLLTVDTINLKIKDAITISFTDKGSIWFEYKESGHIVKTDLLSTDKSPAKMWDIISIFAKRKEDRIKELENEKWELFRQGANDFCNGYQTRAEDKFVEACKIKEAIEKLKEK